MAAKPPRHIVVTGAILTPRKQTRSEKDVIAWAHGTEGLADACAPSRFTTLSSDPTFPLYATTVKSFLDQGWTVAATDYAGLGSPGPHPYLIGNSEGRAIIDSVRAARQLDVSLSYNWVAIGHSQGGQGALPPLRPGNVGDCLGHSAVLDRRRPAQVRGHAVGRSSGLSPRKIAAARA